MISLHFDVENSNLLKNTCYLDKKSKPHNRYSRNQFPNTPNSYIPNKSCIHHVPLTFDHLEPVDGNKDSRHAEVDTRPRLGTLASGNRWRMRAGGLGGRQADAVAHWRTGGRSRRRWGGHQLV